MATVIARTSLLPASLSLLDRVERLRLDAAGRVEPQRRAEFGQFFTPAPLARFMANLVIAGKSSLSLLDAGAGVGSLFSAVVSELCGRQDRPGQIEVTAYEIDPTLIAYLHQTIELCTRTCAEAGIIFEGRVVEGDFIRLGVEQLGGSLFEPPAAFDCVILNPPYRKINTNSETRQLLRAVGIETSNLYTGFLGVAGQFLRVGGELVAITPRSFCNGPYFQPFRAWFLREMSLRQLHVFESRSAAFRDDAVLQENVIFRAVRAEPPPPSIRLTSSSGPDDRALTVRDAAYTQVVRPDDSNLFIRLIADELGNAVSERMGTFRTSLAELGLTVSTGRVVDFRARDFLRDVPGPDTAPLIYPTHLRNAAISWPKPNGNKPNAILASPDSEDLLVPAGVYVLVKRFSAKEERRRVVAAVYDSDGIASGRVGFENHLNYYHQGGKGMSLLRARGLAAFLNSTLVDEYFRHFSGHTQVNATDLRSLRYPSAEQLERLGARVGAEWPAQEALDRLIDEELPMMSDESSIDPVRAKQKIDQALAILKDFGLPRGQQNVRSALTLLALVDVRPETSWSHAGAPLRGITPMIEFFVTYYGKAYQPNSRESVRKETVHQFVQAALAIQNPDRPDRPTNSPLYVYQIEPDALEVIRAYGTDAWDDRLRTYLASVETLARRYAREREMLRIPIILSDGTSFSLSPGGQNILIEHVILDFCTRFTPGGTLIYVGDTGEKFGYFDDQALANLGVMVEEHGKMPDVIVHDAERDWLVLVEAVTTHGPVNPKRHEELKALFRASRAGLVFVTAFLDRSAMGAYLREIAWETEVWIADAPDHLIHFDGERFLGPH